MTFNVAIPTNGFVVMTQLKNVMEMNFMFFGWDKQFRTGSIDKIYGSEFLFKLYSAGGFVAMAAIPVALALLSIVGLMKAMGKMMPCLCETRLSKAFE